MASLSEQDQTIVDDLNRVQGPSVDIGGYHWPKRGLVDRAMHPSETLNQALAEFTG